MSEYVAVTPALRDLRWRRFTDYRHAQGRHLVPITAPESGKVASSLPLAFVADENNEWNVHALIGLESECNHCLDDRFGWRAAYVPAFLRTSPFRLMPVSDEKPTSMALFLERESPWVTPDGEERIWTSAGQLTEQVSSIFTFLKQWQTHDLRTRHAVNALAECEVLVPWVVETHHGGSLPGLFRVDESRLCALEDEPYLELKRRGALPLAYAQMLSTHQVAALERMASEAGASESVDIMS
ncbi:SapC family protein [Halomonas sp. ANAO-440]|uniref:SapC family protein n=1 Tax=Halomonas sp. ANAO-440 TaxID=2861360 RepID=UPI001CAA7D89|nr:SapC family protein [Halomonas sp. ANAO-440]MBZ0332561.1 SapC family protein [Halomonas sp. ANAO-440]